MPTEDVELTELVSEVEKRAYIVQRFRASFIKTKHSTLFEKDMKVEGRLIFRKPDQFKLVTSGDISVSVVSDGSYISVVHDGKDEEIYTIQGQRDTARFADPLLLLVDSIGKGAFHKFGVQEKLLESGETMVEIDPKDVTSFERVSKALIWLDPTGQFKRVKILFENGNWDETVFLNWSILSEDSADMMRLDQDIRMLRKRAQEDTNDQPRVAVTSRPSEEPLLYGLEGKDRPHLFHGGIEGLGRNMDSMQEGAPSIVRP
jgi:outer membrane lipoprotein-sorting protein